MKTLSKNLREVNGKAEMLYADSIVGVDNIGAVRHKRVVVIEDGPTITHGGMLFGAGTVAARKYGAKIVDAKPYAVGTIKDVLEKYPHIKKELPAVGYSAREIKDLEDTINRINCDSVVSATPTDLSEIMSINKPIVQVSYELRPKTKRLGTIIGNFVKSR